MPKSVWGIKHQDCERDLDTSAEMVKEIFPLQLSIHDLDDLKFVKLHLESGSHVRIQVDMGAQCNVILLDIYKRATGDLDVTSSR